MKWRKLFIRSLPVVPDDKAERDQALAEAEERLARAVQTHKSVRPLVNDLRKEGDINHYIQRIRAAYAHGEL